VGADSGDSRVTTISDFVDGIAAEARRIETPCGDGTMAWRVWGSGPPLVLLHGGYGSWMHWIRNVLPLAREFTVVAPDLPGLGESATPPEPHTPKGLARIIIDGFDKVLPGWTGLHVVGFSFGGILGTHVAAQLGPRLQRLTIVGSNGMGLVRQPTDLHRVASGMSEAERLEVHRHNLGALMIADPAHIDDLAVYIQSTNAPRGRIRSRRFSRSDALAGALPMVKAQLAGIWGERDATAYPYVAERARVLREAQPGARFEVIAGAGHWVQYESAERFNAVLADLAR
jgi:2-hydroxy-6-oxonona-2,4-dienedioate hydrolase